MFASLLPMPRVKPFIGALRRAHTYDVRRNPYVGFGFFWGLPVPFFSVLLDLTLAGSGRTPLDAILAHPVHLFFLAHPFLFAVVFGALGTVRHDLEEENRGLIERLRQEAITDPLTGLYNRRFVLEALKNALHRARRSEGSLTVILIDLNGFKAVNEGQGHAAGDRVLREVAQSLRELTRQSDTLARYGGDEFLVVVLGDLDSTVSLLNRAEEAVKQSTGLTFSAGIARWPEDGDSAEALIAAADSVLARAKSKVHEIYGTPGR